MLPMYRRMKQSNILWPYSSKAKIFFIKMICDQKMSAKDVMDP